MKHIRFKADISDWSLESVDSAIQKVNAVIEKSILMVTADALQYIFSDDETYLMFPTIWFPSDGCNGEAPKDPLEVYLRIGANNGRSEKPIFSFSIRDNLLSAMDDCKNDGSFYTGLALISKSLRNLADELDAALTDGKKHLRTND